MTSSILLIAEGLVAVLLIATIMTCLQLHRRIVRLKADEMTMRQTIGELVIATETAERAIGGLRNTLSECDRTLAERLRTADRYATDLSSQIEAGEDVIERIARIVEASQLIAPSGQQANSNHIVEQTNIQQPMHIPAASEPQPVINVASPAEQRLSKAAAMAQSMVERAVRRLEGQAA